MHWFFLMDGLFFVDGFFMLRNVSVRFLLRMNLGGSRFGLLYDTLFLDMRLFGKRCLRLFMQNRDFRDRLLGRQGFSVFRLHLDDRGFELVELAA
jgi:hypothetical protein